VDAPTVEPEDLSTIMLALMWIEGNVNHVISLLERDSDGEDDA
jgi:hypothetical protein